MMCLERVSEMKCKWCGDRITTADQKEECNDCYELRERIERRPDVTALIVESVILKLKKKHDALIKENELIKQIFSDL